MLEFDKKKKIFFTKTLLEWYAKSDRPLPWKNEKNPYFIWLSEVILQQTRVEQGTPYFKRFVDKYPLIKNLADAPEDEVLKLWQGLGYYTRARNLHATAKYIAYELDSIFPKTYKEILALKGVGEYTAAAIASFAYQLPHVVVDGNVYRVLSRYFGIRVPIDNTNGKTTIKKLANQLLSRDNPAKFNQAIMDFGATHCKPKRPKCLSCPFKTACFAYQNQLVTTLPIKSKKIKKRQRFFNYLIIRRKDNLFLHKREEKDIWKNLYEFPLIESTDLLETEQLQQYDFWKEFFSNTNFNIKRYPKTFKQNLTHQKIIATFWIISVQKNIFSGKKTFIEVNQKNLNKFAFPKIIDCYLNDNALYLFI